MGSSLADYLQHYHSSSRVSKGILLKLFEKKVLIIFKIILLLYFRSILPVCLCTTFTPGAHRGQKRALNPLELNLQTAVNRMWVVGIKPGLLEEQQCS